MQTANEFRNLVGKGDGTDNQEFGTLKGMWLILHHCLWCELFFAVKWRHEFVANKDKYNPAKKKKNQTNTPQPQN